MKVTVLITLSLVLGFSQALDTNEIADPPTPLQSGKSVQGDQVKRKVLRRTIRSEISNLAQQYNAALDRILIKSCKDNGEYEIAGKLQPAFDEMRACLRKKTIFLTPRDEYLSFIEGCRTNSTELTKSCLKKSQHYYLDAILKMQIATINLLYDNYDTFKREVIEGCLTTLKNDLISAFSYRKCLIDVSKRTNDTARIAETKERFCKSMLPAVSCFTDMIETRCDSSTGLRKFTEGYINSRREICAEN